MTIQAGTYTLGPEQGTLSVKTGRTGAAAKAGHDLLLHVTAWQTTLVVAEDATQSSVLLEADATSLVVREGTGGMQSLGDGDKASIRETIDDDILKRQPIQFRSTSVEAAGDHWNVRGDLTLVGKSVPLTFALTIGDDSSLHGAVVKGSAVVKQSDWGIKPYSTLFGALKVADEVVVAVDATLPSN
jgi:polyisoprenoid-binding protein YceI